MSFVSGTRRMTYTAQVDTADLLTTVWPSDVDASFDEGVGGRLLDGEGKERGDEGEDGGGAHDRWMIEGEEEKVEGLKVEPEYVLNQVVKPFCPLIHSRKDRRAKGR
jgi:hypothetical protein